MQKNGEGEAMQHSLAHSGHVMPFKRTMERIGLDPRRLPNPITLSRDDLQWLLKELLRGIDVDEGWYRMAYPDVDEAIRQGMYKSAKHHFVENGYFEGRRPGQVIIDESWYLQANPDIAEGIASGEIGSCQEHFDRYGEAEGRLPREY